MGLVYSILTDGGGKKNTVLVFQKISVLLFRALKKAVHEFLLKTISFKNCNHNISR